MESNYFWGAVIELFTKEGSWALQSKEVPPRTIMGIGTILGVQYSSPAFLIAVYEMESFHIYTHVCAVLKARGNSARISFDIFLITHSPPVLAVRTW